LQSEPEISGRVIHSPERQTERERVIEKRTQIYKYLSMCLDLFAFGFYCTGQGAAGNGMKRRTLDPKKNIYYINNHRVTRRSGVEGIAPFSINFNCWCASPKLF